MSEFSDAFQEVFDAVAGQAGDTLTAAHGHTCTAVVTPLLKSKLLRDSGLMPEVECTAEILRSDLTRLKIADRSKVQIGGETFQVLLIEEDSADPCVRLHLKRFRGA